MTMKKSVLVSLVASIPLVLVLPIIGKLSVEAVIALTAILWFYGMSVLTIVCFYIIEEHKYDKQTTKI